MDGANGGGVGDRLRYLIEVIEEAMAEVAQAKEREKDRWSALKEAGFDRRTAREVIKLRALSAAERAEREELLAVYKAALGMLGDTPLGQSAMRRLARKPPPPDEGAEEGDATLPGFDLPPEPAQPPPPSPEDLVAARAAGAAAQKTGAAVLANPHLAGDPRRAAWDEGWCASAGSNGMDIPAAFRRTTPPKAKKNPPPPGPGGGP